MDDPQVLIAAHSHCSNHRAEVLHSDRCGCFYCGEIYPPSEIRDWIDRDETALCPHCHIDSVIGSASGYPLTPEFLRAMEARWFGVVVDLREEL
jgi:hypothetical protein